MTAADDEARAFLRALGDELRQARRRRGWTRKDLLERLGLDVSEQTVASYELGTRQCPVFRFVELARALDVPAPELLARALQRVAIPERPAGLYLELAVLAHVPDTELGPLRRWARARLREAPADASATVRLGLTTLDRLADVCGIDTIELIGRLHRAPAPQAR